MRLLFFSIKAKFTLKPFPSVLNVHNFQQTEVKQCSLAHVIETKKRNLGIVFVSNRLIKKQNRKPSMFVVND